MTAADSPTGRIMPARRPLVAAMTLCVLAAGGRADDGNGRDEAALKRAAAAVGPSVVKIETSGGTDTLGAGPARPGQGPPLRRGTGPTTGLVVGANGYVISSAFNFANKPSGIFVTVPGRPRLVAKQVATDTTRMLTLLKVEAAGLPVPVGVPAGEVRIGQWAVALGRALDPDVLEAPSMSVGIVSSVGRMNGKALQCDAKVSPVNYGGPLVAVDGRVFGVLVPASPQGDSATAGVEWYDSGIGFAIPFADVLAAADRLKPGKDLTRGLLGVTPAGDDDPYNAAAVVDVAEGGAADLAGVQAGDTVTEIDGRSVRNFFDIQQILGPKYAGDAVAVAVTRAGKPVGFKAVTLAGSVPAPAAGFLGVLPVRDDPDIGVAVRFVYPNSPAAAAKLAAGDRILKAGPAKLPPVPPEGFDPMPPVVGRAGLAAVVGRTAAGTELKLEVKKAATGKTETVTVKLAGPTDDLPKELPLASSAGRALEPAAVPGRPAAKKPAKPADRADKPGEVGVLKRTNPTLGRETWLFVPDNYDKNVAHGVIVWFHRGPAGTKDADDLAAIFGGFCADNHFILVGPKSKSPDGWRPSETEEVVQDVQRLLAEYTVDRARVVAHGMGDGGQMAVYVGFAARDLVRGVAVTGATLGSQPRDPVPGKPLSFFIVGGEQDPLVKDIAAAKPALEDKKYPVVYRQLKEFGKEYLLDTTLAELMVWLDSLDKI